MKSTSLAKIYGLLGFPIAHSLSPSMHNAAFKAGNINAEYRLFPVKPEELGDFLNPDNLKSRRIFGLNVTMPYKEKVIPYIKGYLHPTAVILRAVNTIRVSAEEEKLEGFNTDGMGFCRHLTEKLKFDYSAKKIAIIGAGGAAKAVSASLTMPMKHCGRDTGAEHTFHPPKSITICDTDKIKADKWVEELKKEDVKSCAIKSVGSIEELNIQNQDLLINATAVGMNENDPCLVKPEMLHSELLVYDLIYSPPETKLLKLAREKGLRNSNGRGMLLYQGAGSFNIWTGIEPPVEIMRRALWERLKC